MTEVPRHDIASTILPGDSVTALLQAALWQSSESREAWERWRRATGSVAEFLRYERNGLKRILPLLQHNLRLQHVTLDCEVGPILRAAAVREEVRFRTFASYGRAALDALAAAGVEPIVLAGAAAAALYYPSAGIRHCHDLDLLVLPGEQSLVAAALSAAGFPMAEPVANTRSIRFIHRSGLPIECHVSPIEARCFSIGAGALRARSRPGVILGSTCRVPCAGDMLARICGHALANPRRRSMAWLADAYLLVRREESPWPSFLEAATAMRVELPAAVILTYLRDRLGAPIPDAVLTEIRREAALTSRARRRVSVELVRRTRGARITSLWCFSGWGSRFAIRRWLHVPLRLRLLKRWMSDRFLTCRRQSVRG